MITPRTSLRKIYPNQRNVLILSSFNDTGVHQVQAFSYTEATSDSCPDLIYAYQVSSERLKKRYSFLLKANKEATQRFCRVIIDIKDGRIISTQFPKSH